MDGKAGTTDEQRAREVARALLNTPPRPLKARPKSVFTLGERSEIVGLERAAARAMGKERQNDQ